MLRYCFSISLGPAFYCVAMVIVAVLDAVEHWPIKKKRSAQGEGDIDPKQG